MAVTQELSIDALENGHFKDVINNLENLMKHVITGSIHAAV